MSTLNKGRSLEQQTHDGTSSIATMGAGCTGRRNLSRSQEGNQQSEDSAGRTDDLLSGCVDEDKREHGFQTGTQYRQGESHETGPDTVRRSER
ncbi:MULTISPECIES: hypothetical protein [unclassified Duganella]|uniref:hypothetical protein n=1 Tax=unclassified Duganella TaxID=2636909 RepID=UPI0006F264E1|nr:MULTISPECIES: hypothetical protein [unclassified Duganella]KQV45420.1 hypothetical protein ASD07_18070 [Duganella sp. Root336D2]KRB93607.1 hypothetical protein ASE26_27555 [Duganella sp. Root198D2]